MQKNNHDNYKNQSQFRQMGSIMSEEREMRQGWIVKKLGDVCFTTSGGTPSRKTASNYQGNIPWVKSGELDKGVITKTEEYISGQAVENSSAKIFPKGTLLIALYGATIGKLGFLGIDAATNQAICGIFKNEIIDLQFLKYYLFNKRNKLIEQGAGGAQPNISQTILKDLDLVIPPFPEQHRIVAKIEELFSSLDKGTESLKTAQAQLKVYRQAVLKWAFEGKLTNKNVKEGELPEGWKERLISEVAEINPPLPNKENIDRNLEVQFLPMKLVEEIVNKIQLTETRKFSDVLKGSYTPFIDGDIIFAKVTPCMENGKIAIVNHLKNRIGFGSSEFHVLRCSGQILNRYLHRFIVQDVFRNKAQRAMTGAVGLRRVPKQFIENYLIPLPPTIFEQKKIIQEIESRLSVCDKIEECISTSLLQAEALRQSILKKAFEGKLVEQDPNDESASVLLERIKAERENNKPVKKMKF
jgi:type I restriction enzyme, S subunit